MGDLIARDKLLEDMPKNDELFSMDVRRVILEQPIVEAVPVVRCKDCGFAEFGCCADGFMYCSQNQSVFPDDGFCYMGYKKEKP